MAKKQPIECPICFETIGDDHIKSECEHYFCKDCGIYTHHHPRIL